MSSLHLPKVVTQRGKSSLEVERENFERRQTVAINKAINTQETPVKEKHVRNIILGTFQGNGGGIFWTVASKLPVQANPIVCWKFLHVMHKLLRDGHPNVVLDSMKYRSHLTDLGKLWGHLKEGYGRLIASYCKLLKQKLSFHRKFGRIPGNLVMTDEVYNKICGSDVNSYFEFSIDMLDYLDEILSFQQAVFGSLDMSRANSMTTSGQCRLAPLIVCILDSCQLYDYLVKSLFRLHSSLPPDTLSGHRDRFLQGYKKLKQFYYNSHNLQYFKNLVQVPLLPDDPPNFLIASDFSKHVKPVAVVPNEPEPEVELDTPDDAIGNLIDTSSSENDRFEQTFSQDMGAFNFNGRPPEPDERDLIIERLQREILQLKEELQRVKTEDHRIIVSLKDEISKLEKILSELRLSADQHLKENESLRKELEESQASLDALAKLPDAEKQAKANQEKFQKMKDIYGKLREEHVQLLRTHADTIKQLTCDKKILEEKGQIIKETKLEMERMEEEKRMIHNNLQKSADDVSSQLALVSSTNSQLEKQKEELETNLNAMEESKTSLETELEQMKSQVACLESEIADTKEDAGKQGQELSSEIAALTGSLAEVQKEKKEMEEQLGARLSELEGSLKQTLADKQTSEEKMAGQISQLQQQLDKLTSDKRDVESRLAQQMDDLHRKLIATGVAEGKAIIQDALDQNVNPTHTTVTCTAEYLLMRGEPVLECLAKLRKTNGVYTADKKDLESFIAAMSDFSHHLGDCIIHGFATSHSAQIEPGEELSKACCDAGTSGIKLLDSIDTRGNVTEDLDQTIQQVQRVLNLAEALVPKMEDVKVEEIGDLVDTEMHSTTAAVEAAAAKMEEMLQKTRQDATGIELEVNERILDSCNALMKAIKVLIEKSRDVQREIVSQGRGTSTAKEFYMKHHRWTEGLISAAKAVGWGASNLLDTADKVVNGEGKFEEIMVCAQDISASTAQLVVASKVKADRGSKRLSELSAASKIVNESTGNVVASAKTASQVIEDKNLMDFSQLSLHDTKKLQMQSQVRVIQLESELEKERRKLGDLRRQQYHLAGEDEGWEVNEKR
ncbi:huntingtin-interacting protein 1-like isoform X2 [Gigantopelta aegis]|uniref:huntingtin-interacting protein 1-like isoform X2 n=1 Tax=Gigantopelta aegis TaxID=1735272 RepID=UPI001B88C1A1|nr:huntingtin-interacting protein 1-like isoform X2 [Gigantopelta aegis]